MGAHVESKVKNFWKIIWIIIEDQATNFTTQRLNLPIYFYSKRVWFALTSIVYIEFVEIWKIWLLLYFYINFFEFLKEKQLKLIPKIQD